MEATFENTYNRINKISLIELNLPEDQNFIKKTREFQDKIKELDKMLEIDQKHIKNIYFLSSEMMQAVIHNGVFVPEKFVNCIKLYYADNKFYILSQNVVVNDKIPRICLKFDEVNSAFDMDNTHEELAIRYNYKLKNTPMAKAGISVGVLDLARRSLNKLLYNFEKIDQEHSIFSIICTVDID